MTREDQEWKHRCHSEEFWQMEVCGAGCVSLLAKSTKTTVQIKRDKLTSSVRITYIVHDHP